jgi:hypothetical protein
MGGAGNDPHVLRYCWRGKGKPKGRSLNWGSMAGREGARSQGHVG